MNILLPLRFVRELLALSVRGVVLLVRMGARRALSQARRVHDEQSSLPKNLRPLSRLWEDPLGECSHRPPLQTRWLARVLVASRPLGP